MLTVRGFKGHIVTRLRKWQFCSILERIYICVYCINVAVVMWLVWTLRCSWPRVRTQFNHLNLLTKSIKATESLSAGSGCGLVVGAGCDSCPSLSLPLSFILSLSYLNFLKGDWGESSISWALKRNKLLLDSYYHDVICVWKSNSYQNPHNWLQSIDEAAGSQSKRKWLKSHSSRTCLWS